MPDGQKDRRLDKLALWSLQTVFGIALLVASWFLGGLYERLEKVDTKVNANATTAHVNAEKLDSQSESNRRQWQKISDLESRVSRLEGQIHRHGSGNGN
jgi:hypothetical protein